jgi:hypothetical protein
LLANFDLGVWWRRPRRGLLRRLADSRRSTSLARTRVLGGRSLLGDQPLHVRIAVDLLELQEYLLASCIP